MFDIYVSIPYSHPESHVRRLRYERCTTYAGRLMTKGLVVYSPITHSHPIAERVALPETWEFWQAQDFVPLSMSRELHVLQLPGWEESVGVRGEIEFATQRGIAILYVPEKELF